jgi:hypothetical protein
LAAAVVGLCAFAPALAQESPPSPEKKSAEPLPQQVAPTTPAAPQGLTEHQKGRGKLFVQQNSWDFGRVPKNARVTHEFVLQNTAKDTLFIEQVKPICGCTTAPLTRNRLSPGEKLPLAVTFNSGPRGGDFNKAVWVISSDPDQSHYSLQFEARVADSAMKAFPSGAVILLDRATAGRAQRGKVALANPTTGKVNVSIVDPPPDFLKTTLSVSSLAPGEVADIMVETAGKPPSGLSTSSLTVELAGRELTRYTIPITGIGMTN